MAAAAKVLDGKAVARAIQSDLQAEVEALTADGGRRPQLVAVLVGDNAASGAYVRSKAKTCERVGMIGRTLRLPDSVQQAELESTIDALNGDPEVDGILVQLPLPAAIDERPILERISPEKDVDGFHPVNVGRLWSGEECLAPATPSGVIELLRREKIPMKGRHAVIVGRSNIVGKPMAALLLRENATVTICHSRTADLAAECRRADILIAAVGRTALIGPDHVREGAVVIDVGMNRVDEESELERLYPGDAVRRARYDKRGYLLTGDVDSRAVHAKASALTPVPGGVGPLTVAMVVANTLKASRRLQSRDEDGASSS
ncbi:MAG: bifunctional methylenetetrahydrofolate dehydrogenase/methenyltetrahydrofolate cyclohydrolase FolD [Acidobacteriota bacterium]